MEINAAGQVQIWTKNDRYCALKRFDESEITIFDREDRLCNIVVEVTLRVNPNGGTYNGVSTETTYQVEPDETQEVGNPEWTNHRFDGWTFTADSGTFEDGVFTASMSDASLTAEWTEYIALTVENNGGTLQAFNASYAPGATIILEEPTKAGYTFTGWTASGTGASITGSVIKTLTIGSEDTRLTANFDLITYSISYDLVDGTPTGSNPTEYNIESDEITLSNPTKPGYTFTGWTGSNGTTPQPSVTIEAGSIGHKSYTANWKVYPTLTVVWNGGSGQTFNARYAPGTEITLTPPTKSGSVFAYWAVSGTGSSLIDTNVLKIGSENTTLTAHWAIPVKTFSYRGSVETYEITADGTYKLEVWGAKGGGGPNGGYTYGNVRLTSGSNVYVAVGGAGTITRATKVGNLATGGWNGGGYMSVSYAYGYYQISGSGGGATHIATYNRGVLSNYESYPGEVLIVAGGSGGYQQSQDGTHPVSSGGTGGGLTGGKGGYSGTTGAGGMGGSQTAGGISVGSSSVAGSFGQGGNEPHQSGAGGGGWYGGGSGKYNAGGGGGSGYLNTNLIIPGTSSTSNGVANPVGTSNGYARITFIS